MHAAARISVKAASEARFVSGHARRQDALERQKRDRQALATARRQALIETVVVADSQPTPAPTQVQAEIICEIPDWMVDIPDDLFEQWSVVARPEGRRCIGEGFSTSSFST